MIQASVSVYEAKASLSRLIEKVRKEGRAITISRHGKPVVDIVPHREVKDRLTQDPSLKGVARFVGDPCAPLDPEDWPDAMR